ncbi:NADP-dependent oxidoreductase domain-containing protein [Umbelopsis sp. AD052]|nr:NADP-dependent oxidoreductase domain-containing protein [Umbelopsis sp. AD052]
MSTYTAITTLNTGAKLPLVGLGTWQSQPNEVYEAVLTAIKAGYRHIDTAWIYGNEKEVGQAIKDSGVDRQSLFVTTKLWNNAHSPQDVEQALERSLKNLQLEYLDLYLMHWPVAFKSGSSPVPKDAEGKVELSPVDYTETYAAMEKLVGDRVRAIGVSNFTITKLQKLLKTATITPAVNQVELHPYLPQTELLDFCKQNKIHVTAYSPLGSTSGPVQQEPVILELAKKYNVEPAQVLISWAVKRGTSVLPKSVTASRIVNNFNEVPLTAEDVNAIDAIGNNNPPRRVVDPSSSWGSDIYDAGAKL